MPASRRPSLRATANEKVQIGCIGVGWQGGSNLGSFLNCGDCRVVAVCDVDAAHLSEAQKRVDGHYKDTGCATYKDFRGLIARPDIDAVCISTPDHWHSIPAIAAANAGKDIFCEKPLSHTLAEGIAMVEAVQRNGRIWQTGSWQRSQNFFRWAAELVQNGYIGKVTRRAPISISSTPPAMRTSAAPARTSRTANRPRAWITISGPGRRR